MLTPSRQPEDGLLSPTLCRSLAILLILATALLRWSYLASPACELNLASDEAHYWQWSRHLDWSYYSKGPLVAWLIRAGTELLGPWAEANTGSLMPAIRFPAVVCGMFLLVGAYVLTKQIYRREDFALAVVIGFATAPVVSVGSMLMTIDAPYTCLWMWTLVATHAAVFGARWWAWPLAGLLVALGILAKYTMVIFLPSLALFLYCTPGFRQQFARPGLWVMLAFASLGAVPILIWNAQHDWVTFHHVFSLAGVATTEKKWYPLGPITFVFGQMAMLLIGWFVLWAAAIIECRPGRESDPKRLYLWWMSVPMFATFWLFSPRTGGGELNWPVTAYISGAILVVGWLPGAWERSSVNLRRLLAATVVGGVVFGGTISCAMLRTETMHAAMARLAGSPTLMNPAPIRKFDPSCRLRGWRDLAREVDRLREELRARGEDPVLIGSNWTLPGELAVYCQGHPDTYSVGPLCDDRHSQYDFWPSPLRDPTPFLGKTFICVGIPDPPVHAGFDEVETRTMFTHRSRGAPVAVWGITVLRGFKGFPALAPRGKQY